MRPSLKTLNGPLDQPFQSGPGFSNESAAWLGVSDDALCASCVAPRQRRPVVFSIMLAGYFTGHSRRRKAPQTRSVHRFERDEIPLSLIHISEPTRQAEISYAVFCLKKK